MVLYKIPNPTHERKKKVIICSSSCDGGEEKEREKDHLFEGGTCVFFKLVQGTFERYSSFSIYFSVFALTACFCFPSRHDTSLRSAIHF